MSILLTADRTLMSDHHNQEFLGFGSSAPPNVLPEWLYSRIFFPPVKTNRGVPIEAPYGLRKVEAKLVDEGFTVLTVDPDHIGSYIDEAKVLGIYAMDPLGLGPASTTFSRILNTGETYSAKCFRVLLEKPEVRWGKKHGIKIVVGGPGAWQFKYRPNFLTKYGINCVVEGEAERFVGKIFRQALNGEKLPQFYEVSMKDFPSAEEIPTIKHPSVNGLVEVGRGCVRGCQFCSVTLRSLRWISYEKIEHELRVNTEAGIRSGILHAEDVLLYGSEGTKPNSEKILKLHRLAKRYYNSVSWSHTSMAAVASSPKLVRDVAEIIIDGRQEWWGTEVGIETGSPEMVRKTMPAKPLPFKIEEWPDVVRTAAGIMGDCGIIPACTLMVGLPEETEEDVVKTIELIDDLRDFESLIVPLFFVPLGRMKDEEWFRMEQVNPLHEELLTKCLEHSLYWAKRILGRRYFKGRSQPFLNFLTRLFILQIEHKKRELKIDSLRMRKGRIEDEDLCQEVSHVRR